MGKPRPKKELAILSKYNLRGMDASLIIQVASEDAGAWVNDNLPEFGELNPYDEVQGRYWFDFPSEMYDFDEMVTYVETMGAG